MKKLYTILLAVLLAAMLGVGIWSLADTDPTGSVSEKRTFQKPQFSVQALLDGTYIPALETYYSDTFPGRETLLNVNRMLNRFYYYLRLRAESPAPSSSIPDRTAPPHRGERAGRPSSSRPRRHSPKNRRSPLTPAPDETPEQQTLGRDAGHAAGDTGAAACTGTRPGSDRAGRMESRLCRSCRRWSATARRSSPTRLDSLSCQSYAACRVDTSSSKRHRRRTARRPTASSRRIRRPILYPREPATPANYGQQDDDRLLLQQDGRFRQEGGRLLQAGGTYG